MTSQVVLTIVLVELLITAIVGIAFIVLHAQSPWRETAIGWQLMIMSVSAVGEAICLILLGFGLAVPGVIFAVGYGAIDIVMIRWLWLLLRARKKINERNSS